jgi:hypothetical protein
MEKKTHDLIRTEQEQSRREDMERAKDKENKRYFQHGK